MANEASSQTALQPAMPPEIDATGQGSEIDPVRTETIFSRMPLHVLSKSGKRPQINIEKRSSDGKVEERWKVSYNEEYGPARQLAYDIHTLVIERAIEEAFDEARRTNQPFPRLIPLSSLNDVANRLGPNAETRDTNRIKKALSQNAGILITAFKRYRGNDGVEYTIEGVFTPYGIFFFGQKMPTGERADQVYINLNDAYFEAWSRSATRPLDYNYKAQLPPIPRRFYELVSYAMYGAIKNGQPVARYRYSEFCKQAPQLRYETFDQVKKQMYKIHRPHLAGNYILKVKFEETRDEQGRADWWMVYTPGPRAFAEFGVFTGKKPLRSLDAVGKAAAGEKPDRAARQKRLPLLPEADQDQLAGLMGRGVGEAAARKLLSALPAGFDVMTVLEWGDHQIAAQPGKFTNPPGFYISLLRDRLTPPPTFESSAVRKARHDAELARQKAHAQRMEREEAEHNAAEAELDQLEASEPARYRTLYDQAKRELYVEHPHLAEFARGRGDSKLHDGAIRARIKKELRKPHQTTETSSRQGDRLQESAGEKFAADLHAILTTPQLKEFEGRAPIGPREEQKS